MQSRLLKYTNARGESITFSNNSSFFIGSVEGLGDVNADIQSQKAPYQDGFNYIDSVLEPRILSFQVNIRGLNDTDISQKRAQLAALFNPKLGPGVFEYKYGNVVRIIDAIAEHIPKYGTGFENLGRRHQKASVDLICPNPYWRTPAVVEEPIFIPLFQFPFEGEFQMGMQQEQRVIYNDGDAPAPLQIEFHGPATNPKIINNTTGEFIRIKQVLREGERMMIDTTDGNKSVYFVDELGIERNVFNWLDLNSSFFKLEIGENEIEYTADSDIQGAVMKISYSKLYTAI